MDSDGSAAVAEANRFQCTVRRGGNDIQTCMTDLFTVMAAEDACTLLASPSRFQPKAISLISLPQLIASCLLAALSRLVTLGYVNSFLHGCDQSFTR